MMKKKERIFWIVGFYVLTLALFAVGTFYDLRIDQALYNPENGFALFLQKYGEVPRFALWGPAAAVLYATRAWECETTVSVIDFFKRKLGKKDGLSEKTRATLLRAADFGYGVGFLVLGYFSWQKLIRNVVKQWFSDEVKESTLYTILLVTTILVVDVLAAYLVKRKGNPDTLKKLKPLAYGGIVFGILYRVSIDPIKDLVERTRFHEMIDPELYNDPNFHLYTPWYVHGNGGSSFPSGHTASGAATFLSLSLCDALDCCKNKERLFFVLSWGYTWLLGFTRLIMGKHFLTDVTMGALLGFTFCLLARELFTRRAAKKLGMDA